MLIVLNSRLLTLNNNRSNDVADLDPRGSCSCLSNMYLAASTCERIDISIGFQYALAQVKSAINTASDICFCDFCPRQRDTARQNILLINTLLTTIASTCDRILKAVSSEAARAQAEGEKKTLRMGDSSPQHMHLHTGTLNCPMGFDVALDAQEWRSLAFRVIRAELFDAGTPAITLERLCSQLEDRQKSWHDHHITMTASDEHIVRTQLTCRTEQHEDDDGGEHTCLRLTRQVREQLAMLPT